MLTFHPVDVEKTKLLTGTVFRLWVHRRPNSDIYLASVLH